MAATLEQRFDEIERREAAAVERMGLEVGRLSERLEERVGAVETRSAQAIEHVGEQVARMAERFSQRHETLSRELGERMSDSEERSGARVSEAISSIMRRLAEVEEHSQEAIAPVQKAVSSVASKLDQYESERSETIPTLSRHFDFSDFDATLSAPAPQPYASPTDVRMAAFAPTATPTAAPVLRETPDEPPAYFAEDIDDGVLVDERRGNDAPHTSGLTSQQDDPRTEAPAADQFRTAPPPPEDPFWAPEHGIDPFAAGAEDMFGAPAKAQAALTSSDPARDVAPPKNDYLANARRVARGSLPRTRREPAPTPKLSLRGKSRIILWTATTAIAALLIGGAWYFTREAGEPAGPDNLARISPAPAAAAPGAQQASAVVAGPLAPRDASLEQAAQAGDLTAQYELALQRLTAGRSQDGVALLRRAADGGFAMAQYRLAKLYERGEGVPVDLNIARQWTERAAGSGNRRAMHDLGVYFARGEGAPRDEAAAFRWFRQAAELGVGDSQYNLGVLYQQGRGVNRSASEALFWYMVAARQGDQDALARATALETQLPQIQVQQARARAQAFRPRAANGVANGEFGARPWVRS